MAEIYGNHVKVNGNHYTEIVCVENVCAADVSPSMETIGHLFVITSNHTVVKGFEFTSDHMTLASGNYSCADFSLAKRWDSLTFTSNDKQVTIELRGYPSPVEDWTPCQSQFFVEIPAEM
jgi:hypothetical protein